MLFLMDLVMLTINGIDATTKIRKLKNRKKVRIIGICASTFDEEQELFINCEENNFIKNHLNCQKFFTRFKSAQELSTITVLKIY